MEIVETIYGPLLDELKISPTLRKQFLELTCDERQAAFDVVSFSAKNGMSYLSNPETEAMTFRAATSTDRKLRELLTPDEFNAFIDYRNMRTIQVSVAKASEDIADSGAPPLTESQSRNLIQVFVAAQTPGQQRRAPINAVLNLAGHRLSAPVIEAARAFLSAPQIAAMETRAGQTGIGRGTIGAPAHKPKS